MPLLVGLGLLILAEISLYVTLGAAIGLPMTLLVVLGTGVAGALITRAQGRHMMDRLIAAAAERRNPLPTAGDGMLKALAGVLLILPGFLTDMAGLILLVPQVRRAILARMARGMRRQAADLAMRAMLTPRPAAAEPDAAGVVIDGTAEPVPPNARH